MCTLNVLLRVSVDYKFVKCVFFSLVIHLWRNMSSSHRKEINQNCFSQDEKSRSRKRKTERSSKVSSSASSGDSEGEEMVSLLCICWYMENEPWVGQAKVRKYLAYKYIKLLHLSLTFRFPSLLSGQL